MYICVYIACYIMLPKLRAVSQNRFTCICCRRAYSCAADTRYSCTVSRYPVWTLPSCGQVATGLGTTTRLQQPFVSYWRKTANVEERPSCSAPISFTLSSKTEWSNCTLVPLMDSDTVQCATCTAQCYFMIVIPFWHISQMRADSM